MTEESKMSSSIEGHPALRDAALGDLPRQRRQRALVVAGAVAVLVVATGLVSAYRYQPLLQTYQGQFGEQVVAWNSSRVTHTFTQISDQVAANTGGFIYEDIWTEPTGAYNVEVVVTIDNVDSRAVTIEGLGAPAPGVPKSHLTAFFYKSGSYGSEGGTPWHPFTLAAHHSTTVVVDYTQVCSPAGAGASYTSYTQMAVTYSFLGFRHTVGVPMDPYVIKRRRSC